jgi:hypothetical protein
MVQKSWLSKFVSDYSWLMEGVTVVCHTEAKDKIASYTASLSLDMAIQVQAPSSVEDNLGSADVLRLLSKHITVRAY